MNNYKGCFIKVPSKTCIECGKTKPITEFYRQAYTGHVGNQCKTCINVKRSVQRHKAKHGKFISKEKRRCMVDNIDYTLKDWEDAMLHFGGVCPFCGVREGRAKKERFDRDHVLAVSRGGKTIRNNVIPCCPKCNRGRGNKDWKEWFRQQSTWSQEREDKVEKWINQ